MKYDIGDIFLDDENDEIEIILLAPELDSDGEQSYMAKFYYTNDDGVRGFYFDVINNHYINTLRLK